MDLELRHPDEFTLPGSIATSTLTLAEIGAVAIFASIEVLGGDDALVKRLQSAELAEAAKGLKAKGVLKIVMNGNHANVTLDIDSIPHE